MDEVGDMHVPVGGDFIRIFDQETFLSMLNSRDEVAVVLKFHLIMEEFINIWCAKITGSDDLFFGLDFVPFKTKVQIAKNLGLSADLVRALDKLNWIRNRYSHKLKFQADAKELESLAALIDNSIPNSNVSKCSEFSVESSGLDENGVRVSQTHSWASGNAKKIFIMCATLTVKMTFWMQDQFNKKDISYALTTGLPTTIDPSST
ncbi:hypothetical protein [Xanthomonas arboricola]|uniref:hypothetical protein n=1 Tax=Xanthomonas arboricola TaxID=56448 RepID=UPI002B31A6AD|nr:hypothetical protein X12_004269 [Xanthomonas arboricola]